MARGYSDSDIEKIRLARWKARTDLQFTESDVWDGRTWHYKPVFKHVQDLEGPRRRMLLAHRGLMKTTINLQAHPIQWIINYPSVALAIFQSNLDKSEDILKSIRHHFRYNDTFRHLFPEHCPGSRIDEWGLKSELTTLARPRSESRREPTVKALSIDKENAGYHFDILKFSDIVEPGTTKTDGAMDNTRREFSLAESLLVSPVYWMDIEGTRYTAKEMYQDIIDRWLEEDRRGLSHSYQIFMQGCYKLEDPVTKKEQTRFTPDTLDWPYLLDARGDEIPWWPKDASGAPRFPLDTLREKQRKDPYDFSCQYLLRPQAGIDGLEAFPLAELQKVTYENYLRNVRPRIQFYTIGLDTAHTTNARSNYTAFTICAWDNANRPYVVKTIRRKMPPSEIVEVIFKLNEEYRPRSFVVEETQFVSGLRVQIETELGKKRAYYRQSRIPWNIDFIKPENDKSKEQRIQNTLQPLYKAKSIRFVVPELDRSKPSYVEADVDAYEALLTELRDFPLGATDDILDSLADQFQPKSWFGRLAPRELAEVSKAEHKRQFERFLNIHQEPTGGPRSFPIGGDHFIRSPFI
jgi:phage terminase large subunit-like protein